MSKHTPGPWEFWNERANGDDTLNIQTTDRGELIAMVDTDWALPITGGNHTANARLVAAAPDLLAACEASHAWAWAEREHKGSTFRERMELANYSQWLTERALAKVDGRVINDEYEGVPCIFVWPSVHLSRADQSQAQAIVERLLNDYHAAIARAKGTA